MKLPTSEECAARFHEFAVPIPVQRHVKKVRDFGVLLANALHEKGVDIDVPLVEMGCLLHDLMKLATFIELKTQPQFEYEPTEREHTVWQELRKKYEGMHESEITYDVLKDDFPEFAEFIFSLGSTQDPKYFDGSIEIKIIHYADSRVQFDKVVPFRERLAYLEKTYASDEQRSAWKERVEREIGIETELFQHLDFDPEDVVGRLLAT